MENYLCKILSFFFHFKQKVFPLKFLKGKEEKRFDFGGSLFLKDLETKKGPFWFFHE